MAKAAQLCTADRDKTLTNGSARRRHTPHLSASPLQHRFAQQYDRDEQSKACHWGPFCTADRVKSTLEQMHAHGSTIFAAKREKENELCGAALPLPCPDAVLVLLSK